MSKKQKVTITADTISNALREKHHNDIFISECKTGPTQFGSHSRFDALVIRKSWAHPAVIGYEIKVSRQDFIHDVKWVDYLEYCNEFYFVSPPGIIAVNEVSDDVGLYWTSGAGNKVYQKKKAKYRDIVVPDSLWRYILMWRARIGDEIDPNVLTEQDDWRRWLENRKVNHQFGYMVGRAIKEEIHKKITEVNNENDRIKNLVAKYEDIKQLLIKLGYDPEHFSEYDAQRRISIGTIDTTEVDQVIGMLERNIESIKSFTGKLRKH